MSGQRYPWNALGIAPTSDQKVIRKAYAAKLKVTRPDEDPAAFQVLLEARDAALHQSHYLHQQCDEDNVPPAVGYVLVDTVRTEISDGVPDVGVVSTPEFEDTPHELVVAPEPPALLRLKARDPSEDIASYWAAVFDELEQASLSDYHHLMAVVLYHLVADLRQQVEKPQEFHAWHVEGPEKNRARFGAFGDVLRDFDRRFGLLKNDTVFFDYLDEEDGRDLINALTMVVGRSGPGAEVKRALVNVVDIHPDAMDAAFGRYPEMLDYYRRARRDDKYPWTLSVPALLFTPFFALRERLHVPAMLSAAAIFAFVVIWVRNTNGANAPYEPLAVGLYVIIAVSLALRWRRMRLTELARKVDKLLAETDDLPKVRETLLIWGQPAKIWGWGPFILFFMIMKLIGALAHMDLGAGR